MRLPCLQSSCRVFRCLFILSTRRNTSDVISWKYLINGTWLTSFFSEKLFLTFVKLWCADYTGLEPNVKGVWLIGECFHIEIGWNIVMCTVYAPLTENSYYLFHVRVMLSGRWIRLWETAGFLDDILSLPGPSALLELLSFWSTRFGRHICLWILSHTADMTHMHMCVSLLSLQQILWHLHF